MIPLEVGNLDGLIILFGLIMFGPPLLFALIGLLMLKKNKKIAKVLFILGGLYLVIGLGICGALLV